MLRAAFISVRLGMFSLLFIELNFPFYFFTVGVGVGNFVVVCIGGAVVVLDI